MANDELNTNADTSVNANQDTNTSKGLLVKSYYPGHYARFASRFWANVIDGIVLGLLLRGLTAALSAIGGEVASLEGWLLLIAASAYQVGLKASRGTTVGYKVMDIKLVSITGENPSLNQVAVRQISAIFSALAFGLGYLWIFKDPAKQSWHDKIAGTYVIEAVGEPIGEDLDPSRSSPMMLRLFACLVLSVSAVVYMFVIRPSKDVIHQAETAVIRFHDIYNSTNSESIYLGSDVRLKEVFTSETMAVRLGEIRTRLGKAGEMSMRCAHSQNSNSEVKIRIEYQTRFETGVAWETFDWRLVGDGADLLAYAVEEYKAEPKPFWVALIAPAAIQPQNTSCTAENPTAWWESEG
jgi:uncharacterized RDD family membrane protein YckC